MRVFARVFAIAASILGAAAVLPAVSLTVGNPSISSAVADAGVSDSTLIDLNNPASATGSLTAVRFGWGVSSCAVAGKVKIFRRTGDSLTLTAEQAVNTLTPSGDFFTAALSPALPIRQGDLIGIYGSGSCGNPVYLSNPFAGSFLIYSGDVEGTRPFDPSLVASGGVAVSGTGIVSEYRAGVIPGVGSGPGLNGANFKTSLQMIAPVVGADVTGRLVFHPVGAGGSVDDPSIDIFVPRGHALSFADVVVAMGQTGFGTLDLIVSADSAVPVTLARNFNDQGSAGSSGLGEELVAESGAFSNAGQIVPAGFTGYLSAPVDPGKARLNIGLRTLDSAAFVTFQLEDSAGSLKATSQSVFPPNYFNQFHAEQMFGMDLAANDVVEVSVSTGSAIVFGATTDNVTNDPSAQFVHPVFGVL